jgi:hypothetical protein
MNGLCSSTSTDKRNGLGQSPKPRRLRHSTCFHRYVRRDILATAIRYSPYRIHTIAPRQISAYLSLGGLYA